MDTIFIKIALRNILKNRLNSIISIVGFSIGIAVCLFIFLFIKLEAGFDNFHSNSDRLYRVMGTFHTTEGTSTAGLTYYPIAHDIKNEIPGVDDFCRVSQFWSIKFSSKDKLYEIKEFSFVDENFFRFFDFELLTGNPETALNSADKIVLTRQKAEQIFGEENPMGQNLMFNQKLFTVSGIAANPPANTQFYFDALASTKYIEQDDNIWTGWGGGISVLSYLLLSEGVTPQQIEQALPGLLYTKINKDWENTGKKFSASLQNIRDAHLTTGANHYDRQTNRSKKSIYVITSICVLILLLSILNYIILYTAQKLTKSKDLGILKINGAQKHTLLFQTYLEVFIVLLFAALFGILLLINAIPVLNSHLNTSVRIGTNIPAIISFLLVLILLVSFIVCFFSTRRIIRSKTIDLIKADSGQGHSKNTQGNLLIAFQFTVVISLLICGFIIARQNQFFLNKDLGFDQKNILPLTSSQEFYNNELSGFKQDLQQLSQIRSVCVSSQLVGKGITRNGYKIGDDTKSTMINVLYTDSNFLECFGIKLISGRNFKNNSSQDKNSILINQKLARRAGWEDPLGKEIQRHGKPLEIIGVVPDFNFASLESAIAPMLITCNSDEEGWYSIVNIRYQTSDIQGLIAEINKLWDRRFPETPHEISFFDDLLKANYKSLEAQQKIISFFSLLGMIIALIGLFGLTVFTTRKRTKEIGIRKVNGAKTIEVMAMLNKDFVKWVAIAFVLACPIAYYAMNKWLENFAYKTELSWWIFALAGLIALVVALLTVSVQSWRAATRNPVESLRYE